MRKKSSYKPRQIRADAHQWVITGMKSVAETDAIIVVRTKNHMALDAVLKGKATRQDIDDLISAINMTEALAKLDIGNDWSVEINEAQQAMLTMCRRGIANRDHFAFTGVEMAAVKLAMQVHDAQLDKCSVKEMEQALSLVYAAIINRHATVITEAA